MVYATSKASDQYAHTRILIRAFASHLDILSVKLLTEHDLEFLSLKGAALAPLSLHLPNATFMEITCHGSNYKAETDTPQATTSVSSKYPFVY